MKLKRLLGVLALGLAVVTLAACGQKSTETIIKNELKDSYTGYSENKAYERKATDNIPRSMYLLWLKIETITRKTEAFQPEIFLPEE